MNGFKRLLHHANSSVGERKTGLDSRTGGDFRKRIAYLRDFGMQIYKKYLGIIDF